MSDANKQKWGDYKQRMLDGYCLFYLTPKAEILATEWLSSRIECIMWYPTYRRFKPRTRARKRERDIIERPLFPGKLFIRKDDDFNLSTILECPHVNRPAVNDGKLCIIRKKELEDFKMLADAGIFDLLETVSDVEHHKYAIGDAVEIDYRGISSFMGEVVKINRKTLEIRTIQVGVMATCLVSLNYVSPLPEIVQSIDLND